ncbi:Hsp70 family protein [Nocardia sp. NPDC060256]|uniref:Hsp70 family protein n=1 Tax=unclassified Nocardia TaxID=2637762 RepID=UPI00366A2BB3
MSFGEWSAGSSLRLFYGGWLSITHTQEDRIMPESQAEAKDPVPVSIPSTTPSDDVATLSIRYTETGPVLVVTGGSRIPRSLPLVNEAGAQLTRRAGQVWRFEVLDFDVLPKDDPAGFLDVDVDSFVLRSSRQLPADTLPAPRVTVALDKVPARLHRAAGLIVRIPGYVHNPEGDNLTLSWAGGTEQFRVTFDSTRLDEGVTLGIPVWQALAGPIGYTVQDVAGARSPASATIAVRTKRVEDQVAIIVFDLGGGTFDVSTLDFEHGASDGLNPSDVGSFLGGDDFSEVSVELGQR